MKKYFYWALYIANHKYEMSTCIYMYTHVDIIYNRCKVELSYIKLTDLQLHRQCGCGYIYIYIYIYSKILLLQLFKVILYARL
jgi:hypothetical protein